MVFKQLETSSGVAEFLLIEIPKTHKVYLAALAPKEYDLVIRREEPEMTEGFGDTKVYVFNPDKEEYLGIYTPSTGKIDFEVKEEWVEKEPNDIWYINYHFKKNEEGYNGCFPHDNAKESLLSLLKSETEKEFPFSSGKEDIDNLISKIAPEVMQEVKPKVMPHQFAVIRKKK